MRVLVADDDGTSRLLLKAMVGKLGHECLVAEDGSSAWDLLRAGGIDVLLTDWMMPGLDGPELCRKVRHELDGAYTYIVLITGLGYPEQVMQGMNAGADDYLIKPVDSFAVETRLVAAGRVTALHRQLVDFRTQLERANLELLEQSLTDPLTGLGNRRRMEIDLEHTHARAIRVGRTYGVVLFDIDHFKRYNDDYGHQAGDEVLRVVAGCLDRVVRAGECAYRYGGEEFLLLLPDCDPNDAVHAAERVRTSIAETRLADSRLVGADSLSLSGGVASWMPDSGRSASEVVRLADEALFSAKSAGRDCVRAMDAGAAPTSPR